MTHEKASFKSCYQNYSPKEYTAQLVRDIEYSLPFDAAQALKGYIKDYAQPLKISIFGASHGLDLAALKYGYTRSQILEKWLCDDTVNIPFADGDARFQSVTAVDICEQPLRFSKDVGLCSKFHTCDLTKDWPIDLYREIQHDTDILTCVGVTTYLGVEKFSEIVKLVEESRIQFFCFSVITRIENSFLQAFEKSSLRLQRLVKLKQRNYANPEERKTMTKSLRELGICSPEDEKALMASVYVATN